MNKSKLLFVSAIVAILAPNILANSVFETAMGKFNRAFPSMASDQQSNARAIVKEAVNLGVTDLGQLAYIIATAIGECNLRPIKEYRGRPGTHIRTVQDKYWSTGYYGRGYVQLTWKDNYAKFARKLGVDLVGEPDLAMNPKYAAQITAYGMKNGSFTGKKLGDYINGSHQDFVGARRIINGTDKAAKFAGFAEKIVHA